MTTEKQTDQRRRHVAFFLTDEDTDRLTDYAHRLGFRTAGKLVTAISEGLMAGGFSPFAFFRLGLQLQAHQDRYGVKPDPKKPIQERFWFGKPPLPILDPEWTLSTEDAEIYLASLQAELEQRKQANQTKKKQ